MSKAVRAKALIPAVHQSCCWAWFNVGLMSHQTLYRSYRDGFLQVIWPSQQCQSTKGR